jgi:hypothetical protein
MSKKHKPDLIPCDFCGEYYEHEKENNQEGEE